MLEGFLEGFLDGFKPHPIFYDAEYFLGSISDYSRGKAPVKTKMIVPVILNGVLTMGP